MTSTKPVPVCANPQEAVVPPDGKAAYVSCMSGDHVAEIDLAGWTVTRSIATGKDTVE
jgi:DNA-binding beta-propeller fold protein YncE